MSEDHSQTVEVDPVVSTSVFSSVWVTLDFRDSIFGDSSESRARYSTRWSRTIDETKIFMSPRSNQSMYMRLPYFFSREKRANSRRLPLEVHSRGELSLLEREREESSDNESFPL